MQRGRVGQRYEKQEVKGCSPDTGIAVRKDVSVINVVGNVKVITVQKDARATIVVFFARESVGQLDVWVLIVLVIVKEQIAMPVARRKGLATLVDCAELRP